MRASERPALFAGVGGSQLEIVAVFAVPRGFAGAVGLVVLASDAAAEATAIELDRAASQVRLDRTRSGSAMDADVRAGPWPNTTRACGDGDDDETITLHVFVDHSVISLIAENQTAITAWVHPSQPSTSIGVGVYATSEGATLASIDIWTLADAA